jgi:hypothetical protein
MFNFLTAKNYMAESENTRPKNLQKLESIKHLYAQIQKMPELADRAWAIDQVLLNRLKELKGTAATVVNQFSEQKKVILQRFDNWIMPIAKDVLDNLLQDAKQLKNKLEDKLDHLDLTTPAEWDAQAKDWVELYAQWNDQNALIEKILEEVADRTEQLINKDIQVIQDYQTQSLAHLPLESETFRNVEKRLAHAIEEPLKQLMSLKNKPKEHTSLQQASEWVAKLQERRESYFDQLLMKIDHVIKDVVHLDERKDWTSFLEIEGEIIFMERELHHINSQLSHLHLEEVEKQFIMARLEGLLEHIDELDEDSLPLALKQRVQALKTGIQLAFSQIHPAGF